MDFPRPVRIKFLCIFSIVMSLTFYFYWLYSDTLYSEYTLHLVQSNNSVEWFSTPDWIKQIWIPVTIVIYGFIFSGWTIFRHALAILVVTGLVLSFSSESVCYTSIDLLVLDLWKFSDAILLYILYVDKSDS